MAKGKSSYKKTWPMAEEIVVEESITEEWLEKQKKLKNKLSEKKSMWDDGWYSIWDMSWKTFNTETLDDSQVTKIIDRAVKELKKSEDALSTVLSEYVNVKKWYLDLESKGDPFYVDYNLLYNNVDMLMALSYSNEMKVVFTGTDESDVDNSNIITKTAEYDYRDELWMDLLEYELWMDKFLWWVAVFVWDWWNEFTNSPIGIVMPWEFYRPDPDWRWHADKYRRHGCYGKMTKQQMKDPWNFFNIDEVVDTVRDNDKTNAMTDNWSNINLQSDQSTDEWAYFTVYNHFWTKDDWTKYLATLANGWSLLIRYIELDYKIWGKPVFPLSLDFWKPKKWFPLGIKPYDIVNRKQRVLSLILNLAVKQSVRSSLGNHIIVDEKAVKNRAQLSQLSEFPEVILVDTNGWQKNVNNVVSELQRSWVPQDNITVENRIKQLNYEETSIWPNQLWQSPDWDQTATEIRDNATNANVRLSLTTRVAQVFQKDFWRKRLMMYQYHFPENAKKQVVISREYGDKYMTFEHKYLNFSGDPHIKIVSKSEFEMNSRKLFSNHVVLHSYIEKLAVMAYVPLEVRMSMRKALRLLWYPEDEILRYVRESFEEMEAKSHLYLLNNDEEVDPLHADQIDEHHEDYLEVYKQAKPTKATRLAVLARLRMLRDRKKKDREAEKQQLLVNPNGNNNTNAMSNQMTADMISKWNDWSTLKDIQF